MDVNQPIRLTLDDTNYIPWSQAMSSLFKVKRLWGYISGDLTIPTLATGETDAKFHERLADWDCHNHQIITWLRNATSPTISLQYGRFDTAKEIWDFLKTRYTTDDLAHQYQLFSTLYRMRQEPGQSISAFLSQMYPIWDQLTYSEPSSWDTPKDATQFTFHRDHQRLMLFLMALTDQFEPVRASLLHRRPLPTLEHAIAELISEETRLNSLKPRPVDAVLVAHQSRGTSSTQLFCRYCHMTNHSLLHCPTRPCPHCHKLAPGHL